MKTEIALTAFVLAAMSCTSPSRYDGAPDIAITNVSLVDVVGETVINERMVLIDGHQIVWVGDEDDDVIAAAGRLIDADGDFMIPGLWDSHVHLFTDEQEPEFALPLSILHGVTGVRDMGALLSLEQQLALGKEIAAGERIGPTIISAGALIDGPPGAWPNQMVAATPEEGRESVRRAKAEGWGSVKAYSLLRSDVYEAIADEARNTGMALYGHVPETVTLDQAIAAGQRSISHFGRVSQACSTREAEMVAANAAALNADDNFATLMTVMAGHNQTVYDTWDEKLCRDVAKQLAAAEVAIAPTLMVSDFYTFKDPSADDPRMQTVPLRIRAQWKQADFRRQRMSEEMLAFAPNSIALNWRTFKLMHDAGAPVIAGTDAAWINPFLFHGATLHNELERYVDAGLTHAEALATATVVPATVLNPEGYSGRVEPGAIADILLLDANPLVDIRATRMIDTVIARGRVYDRATLDALREKLEAAASVDKTSADQ